MEGKGVAKNDAAAASLFKSSAEQRNSIAQLMHGMMSENPMLALFEFRQSAEQGNAYARQLVSAWEQSDTMVFSRGREVYQNVVFRKSAEQENAYAKQLLSALEQAEKLNKEAEEDERTVDLMEQYATDLIKVDEAGQSGGPPKSLLTKILFIKLMSLDISQTVISPKKLIASKNGVQIKHGAILTAGDNYSNIPGGTTIHPIRYKFDIPLLGVISEFEFHYYKDSFGDWKFIQLK